MVFCPRGHSSDPLPPGWIGVDFWLTPPPLLLVHVVVECPLNNIRLDLPRLPKYYLNYLRLGSLREGYQTVFPSQTFALNSKP